MLDAHHAHETPYTEEEMDAAMPHVLRRLSSIAARTGCTVGGLIEDDLFGLLCLAYIVAMRRDPTGDRLHARAAAVYVALLAEAPHGFDSVADRMIADSFESCAPPAVNAGAPVLRLVTG